MVSIQPSQSGLPSSWSSSDDTPYPTSAAQAKALMRKSMQPVYAAQQNAIANNQPLPPHVQNLLNAVLKAVEEQTTAQSAGAPANAGTSSAGKTSGAAPKQSKGTAQNAKSSTASADAEALPQNVKDLIAGVLKAIDDHNAGQGHSAGGSAGTGGAAGTSLGQALVQGWQTRADNLQTNLKGKDVVEKADPTQATKRFLAQDNGLGKVGAPPALTQAQTQAIATDPNAGPILPPHTTPIPSGKKCLELAKRVQNGIAAKIVACMDQPTDKMTAVKLSTAISSSAALQSTAGGADAETPQNPKANTALGAPLDEAESPAAGASAPNVASYAEATSQTDQSVKATVPNNTASVNPNNNAATNGTLGFNWTSFFIMVAADQIKKLGKDLKFENILRLLEGKIAVGSDREAVEMEKQNREMDRLEAYNSAMRGFPGFARDATGGLLKKLSNANPIADEASLDYLNSMKNVQHRGPASDMQMQKVLKKIATGSDDDIPLPRTKPGDEFDVQKLGKAFKGAEMEDYDKTTPKGDGGPGGGASGGNNEPGGATGGTSNTNTSTTGRKSISDLVSRLVLDVFPGGPTMRRTLLTPEEMSRLEQSGSGNDKVVKAAYDSTRVTRASDWYGSLGQIDQERRVLSDASKKAYDHANMLDKHAGALEDEAKKTPDQTKAASLRKQAVAQRNNAAVARDYGAANAIKADAFLSRWGLLSRAQELRAKGDATGADVLEARAANSDPNINRYHEALSVAESDVGTNEDRAGDAHRELTNLQDVANQAARRLKEVTVHITQNGAESKSAAQASAERDLLKRTQIDISLRQIGIGGMFKRFENEAPFHVRLSGWMQDSYELSKARFDLARADWQDAPKADSNGPLKSQGGGKSKETLYNEAKQKRAEDGTPIEQHLVDARNNYINARTRFSTEATQAMERDQGAVEIHHVMIDAYAARDPKMVDLFKARFTQALGGKAEEPTGLSDAQKQSLPSADEMAAMVGATSRDRMLKHIDERLEVLDKDKRRTKVLDKKLAEAKVGHPDDPETKALQTARNRMQVEQDNLVQMRDMMRTLDTKGMRHPLWNKSKPSPSQLDKNGNKKPMSLFNNSDGMFSNTRRLVRLGGEGTSTRDVNGATANADAARSKESIWEYSRSRNKQLEKWANGEDVDFTDIDERAAFLTGKAEGVTNVEGSLSVRGNLIGSYRNDSMETLTQMQQNAGRIDFSALNTAEGDMQSSAQENSGLANQRTSEVSQSMQDSWQKLNDMAHQLMQTALSIVR